MDTNDNKLQLIFGDKIEEKTSYFVCIIILTILSSSAYAQSPKTDWIKTFEGTGNDWGRSIVQTSDGGYAITGETRLENYGNSDFGLIKTDSGGNQQWTKKYGGTSFEYSHSVVQTSDRGYALTGVTYSFGAGGFDWWLVKIDSEGNIQWSQTYGGIEDDYAHSVLQTNDGGYAIVGETKNYGNGRSNVQLIKVHAEPHIEQKINESRILENATLAAFAVVISAIIISIALLWHRRRSRKRKELMDWYYKKTS